MLEEVRRCLADFKEYIIIAITLSLFISVVSVMSHPSYKAECNMALGILLLAALAVPVLSLITSLGEFPELDTLPEYNLSGGAVEVSAEAFAEGIALAIEERYRLPSGEVSIMASGFSFSEMRAQRITVILSGTAVTSDSRDIAEFVVENFCPEGHCEVKLNFE